VTFGAGWPELRVRANCRMRAVGAGASIVSTLRISKEADCLSLLVRETLAPFPPRFPTVLTETFNDLKRKE